MLAINRRTSVNDAGCFGELDGQSDGLDPTGGGVVHLDDHFACLGVGVCVHLVDVHDWARGNADALQPG